MKCLTDMTQKYTLSDLLHPWIEVSPSQDNVVSHLSMDTRKIQPGSIFIALKGQQRDGRTFIREAIEKGAVAVLSEADSEMPTEIMDKNVPVFFLPKLHETVGKIAAKFYDYPSKKLIVIGVTGTNGKTSCTQWIAKALDQLKIPCGIIGTLGYGFFGALKAGEHTTPFAIDIQRMLAEFCAEGAKAVAMEVSSHALDQYRVAGVEFNFAMFTNLTHDHLDYHGDLHHYACAKKRLFSPPFLQPSIFNLDDAYGRAWFVEYQNQKPCYGYSLNPDSYQLFPKDFLIYASDFSLTENGINATVVSPWGEGQLAINLLGKFNLGNLLAVLTSLCLMGISFTDAMAALSSLESLPGRMQVLGGNGKPIVVVDYSHTPDSLLQALKSLREHCNGKLWCVFGCGGDRDKSKRPIMGKIAEQYADYVVITDDNPRHEDPESIITDIVTGLALDSAAVIEHNRRQAIVHAIACANFQDIVLVAGKGHERYQQIGDEKIPFSDVIEVQLALNQLEGLVQV